MPTTVNELYQRLQEAANAGEWMESRIHLMFTEIADNMFGDGRLTRDERKALSHGIGQALDAFRTTIEADAAQIYKRAVWADAPEPAEPSTMPGMMDEAARRDLADTASVVEGSFVPLVEGAVRRDGTIPVKLIAPGWGTTGYYPADILERDGPKIFKAGTKMYWNHPTATEEVERPEGDLNALAAELINDARWDGQGPKGPGLYADAKVFEGYKQPIDEMAPHIGVSIRALGRSAQGEADGRRGPIIQQIAAAHSVDFVTKPGAGGQIVQMFEAARGRLPVIADQEVGRNRPSVNETLPVNESEEQMSAEMQKQLTEAQGRLAQVELQNQRLQEALILRDARDFVAGELSRTTLPVMTQGRLSESLAKMAPVKDGQLDRPAYAAQIAEAVKAETEYLQQIVGFGSGRIVGMGGQPGTVASGAPAEDEAKVQKRLAEAFAGLGLNEREVAHAVNGHR